MDNMMTRRGFLAAGASCAALAAVAGTTGCSSSQTEEVSSDASVTYTTSTLCAGCANKCGVAAWVRNGKLWRFGGAAGHATAGGYLCGRGQGLPSLVTSENRLTEPMKADGKGGFTKVSWDEALSDIASHINGAASKTALFQDGRATDAWYAKRFMDAIGSGNYYDDSALVNIDVEAAYQAAYGASATCDTKGSVFTVILGASGDETVAPAEVAKFASAKQAGGRVVAIDPRFAGATQLADEWISVRPGFELAFLLGVAGYLVQSNAYDEDFVAQYGEGFDEFKNAMLQYTPAWAAEKCGVAESKISGVAQGLQAAAPHCHIDVHGGALMGCGYSNSFETVRTAALINAMLGTLNQTGGVFVAKMPATDSAFSASPFTQVESAGEGVVKAAAFGPASCQEALGSGKLDVALFVECDPVSDWPNTEKVESDLDGIGFKVVIDSVITDTAAKADYVLPSATYLEASSVVVPVAAKWSFAAMRNKAVDPAGEARPVHAIVKDLAQACGKGDDFNFELDDVNNALCTAFGAGITADGLKRTAFSNIPGCEVAAGEAPALGTESGKVLFASDVFVNAGLSKVPQYAEPACAPSDHMPRLITGAQAFQMRTYTAAAPKIAEFASDMAAHRAWINPQTAQSFGVADGEEVQLSTQTGKVKVKLRVTSLINPEAVYLPPHYGVESKSMAQAAGFGARVWNLVPRASEVATGAGMVCETLVEIGKAGA